MRVLLPLLATSFVYGCYRGWTLPIWSDHRGKTLRIVFTVANGIKYVVPPFCIVQWGCLGARLCSNDPPNWNNLEFGYHHPSVI